MTKLPPTPPAAARRPGWRLLGGGALLVLTAGLAVASLRSVPASQLGFSGSSTLGPGLHLAGPFARVRLVPVSGRLESVDVVGQTGEGASLMVRLSFSYHL